MNEENLKPKVADVEIPKPAPAKPATSKPEQKYATPVAVTLDDIAKLKPVPAGPAVVSNNEVDDVHLERIIFKNLYARKSLSVHHLQRRLAELGYTEAVDDKDGYYGDYTKLAVERFQVQNELEGGGMVDAKTLTLLFTGDPNVNVII
jgi:peptidoglycan hydrolase-like protein with peptidoglycan-binding domain